MLFKKLPSEPSDDVADGENLNDTVVEFLKKARIPEKKQKYNERNINVIPGKSISMENFEIREGSGVTTNKKKSR